VEEQEGDEAGDGEVRPGASCPRHQTGRGDHRHVGERVVAAEQPDRANIGVPFPETRKHQGGHDIDRERDNADCAHQFGIGRGCVQGAPNRETDYAHAKRTEKKPLRQRDLFPRPCGPGKREKTDKADRPVPEKIEGIRFQRLAIGDEPAEQLGDSEAEVEHHDGQQRTAIGRIGLRARGPPVAPPALGLRIHAAFLTTSSRCRSKRNVRHVRISKDGMMKPVMIGQLASETSTKVTTIRFYESIGLLRSAPRTASGRRTYDASDIERLHFIRNGRRLGFSVDEIRSLMGLAQNPDQDCGAASAIAAQHLKDVEERLAQLAVLRDELAMLSQSCTKARMADCRIMKAIGKGHPQADQ